MPLPLRFASLCCLLFMLLAPAALAQIVVTTTNDELTENDECSLREAIINANNGAQTYADCAAGTSGADVITLPAGTYTLSLPGAFEDGAETGDLDILDDLTINGAGQGTTIIDGDAIDRVFHVTTIPLLQGKQQGGVSAPSFTLNDLTVTGGLVPQPLLKTDAHPQTAGLPLTSHGGGILNEGGTLTLTNVTVTENSTAEESFFVGFGGGIANIPGFPDEEVILLPGDATFTNVTISNNATGDVSDGFFSGFGGGLYNECGTVVMTGGTVEGNATGDVDAEEGPTFTGPGGGIANAGGTITLTNGSVVDNNQTGSSAVVPSVGGPGGGIANFGEECNGDGLVFGLLTIEDSEVTNNTTGNSSLLGGLGGGIANFEFGLFIESSEAQRAQTLKRAVQSAPVPTVNILNSEISGNTTGEGEIGGPGGGIANLGGTVSLTNATVTNNTSGTGNLGGFGGGIFSGFLCVEGSCGEAGEALAKFGSLQLQDVSLMLDETTVSNNQTGSGESEGGYGGGIYNGPLPLFIGTTTAPKSTQGLPSYLVTITASTISGNSTGDGIDGGSGGSGGGLAHFQGDIVIANSTFSGNSTGDGTYPGSGGGIFVSSFLDIADLDLNNVTITDNETGTYDFQPNGLLVGGGGIFLDPVQFKTSQGEPALVDVQHTIIADNRLGDDNQFGPDCLGVFNSQGYNLIGNIDGEACLGFVDDDVLASKSTAPVATGDIVGDSDNPVDPVLGPLEDNGGPTDTHALLPGSPAIDAGNNDTCEDTDQRGVERPIDGDGDGETVCDIGAYEAATAVMTADLELTKAVTSFTRHADGSVSATFTLTVTNHGPDDATGVQVTDTMDERLVLVEAIASQGTFDNLTGVWDVGNLSVGTTATLTLATTASAEDADGGLFNTAEITASDQVDPDSVPANSAVGEDDIGSAFIGRRIPDPHRFIADLSLSKTVDNETPAVGDTVIFTITVSNNGPSHTNGVAVLDLLPEGVEFVSATSSVQCPTCGYDADSGLWTIGLLHEDTSATLDITVQVTGSGTITNTAEVHGNNLPDPDSTPGNDDPQEDDQDSATITVQAPAPRLTDTADALPTSVLLRANYPNPFNPETVIPFAVPEAGHVTLRVYDLLGRVVQTLVDGPVGAGHHTATFQANALPTGVYLVRLQVGNDIKTRRITLVK